MNGNIYPWQTTLWKLCAKQLSQNKLPHALLLRGQSGLGVEEFGKYLINATLCLAHTEEGAKARAKEDAEEDKIRPCGQCQACKLLKSGNHPDFLLVEPPKAESAIPVRAIREVSDFLQITSHYGKTKAVLIPIADRMNRAASNCLLKTLEEPPLGSLILLTSQWASRLPPTVRSRCQTLNFAVPDVKDTAAWLANHTDDDTDEIIRKLENRELPEYPLDAYDMLNAADDEKSVATRKSFHQDCLALIETRDVATVAEKWKNLSPSVIHHWLLEEIQAIARKNILAGNNALLIDRLHKLYGLQVERYKKLNIALNPQLNLESALLEWASASVQRPIRRQ